MNTTRKAGILGKSRKIAGNGPQIVEAGTASNDTENMKSRAGSGNAAKFKPFPPDRRKMYIQKRGVDPDAIRYTPETLSEAQLLELLKVTSGINGLPAVEDLCTPNNAAWIFAVLDFRGIGSDRGGDVRIWARGGAGKQLPVFVLSARFTRQCINPGAAVS